jgi:ATP-binding cassette subfamily B protein
VTSPHDTPGPLPLRRRLGVLRRLIRGADRQLSTLVGGVLAVDTVAATLQTVALKWIIDAAVDRRAGAALAAAVVAAVAAGAVAVAGRILGDAEMQLANQTGVDVDQATLELLAGTPGVEHLERPDHLDQVNLVRGSGADLFRAVLAIARSASLVARILIGLALLVAVHPLLALVPVAAIPSALLVPRAQRQVAAADTEAAERQRASTQLHGLFLRPASAMELRVFGSLASLDRRSDLLWRDVGRIQLAGGLRAALVSSLGWIVLAGGYVGALLFVAAEATQGRATLGDVVLVAYLALRLRGDIEESIGVYGRAAAALTTVDRFGWIEDLSVHQQTLFGGERVAPSRLDDGIRLEGVSFAYPGTTAAVLRDASLHLPAGSTVAVVGANGAGKSTLVKLLTRLHLPTEGHIFIDGVDLSDVDGESWAAATTATFQDLLRLEATVRESVGCGDLARLSDDETVLGALERAEARAMVASWPEGLESPLGRTYRDGRELSGGEWQRLAIARAMMRPAPVLVVLDEPTSALDPEAEQALHDRYAGAARRAAAEGGVTVLVSHRLSSVPSADLIVVLDDGRIAESGSHRELMGRGGLYAEMFRRQADAYS